MLALEYTGQGSQGVSWLVKVAMAFVHSHCSIRVRYPTLCDAAILKWRGSKCSQASPCWPLSNKSHVPVI